MADGTPTPDPVAAALDEIRKRWDAFGEADATPRLLAALDAARAEAASFRRTREDGLRYSVAALVEVEG